MSTTTIVFMVIVGMAVWIGFMGLVYAFFRRISDRINDRKQPLESVYTPGAIYVTGPTGAPEVKGPTGPNFLEGMKCVSCRAEAVCTNGWINGAQAFYCHVCGCVWDSMYYRTQPCQEKSNITCKLHAPSRYLLSELFAELKFGRPAADQHYLDRLINEMTNPKEEETPF